MFTKEPLYNLVPYPLLLQKSFNHRHHSHRPQGN